MSHVSIHPIAPDVCVAPQLDPAAMTDVARAGFRSVVNNRPDFEGGPGQPTSAAVEAAARAAGLEYRYVPVQSAYQMGSLGVQTAVEVLAGKKVPKFRDTGVVMVTRKNIESAEANNVLY